MAGVRARRGVPSSRSWASRRRPLRADAPATIARMSDDAGGKLYLLNTVLDSTNSAGRQVSTSRGRR